jgi:hypothetical protein
MPPARNSSSFFDHNLMNPSSRRDVFSKPSAVMQQAMNSSSVAGHDLPNPRYGQDVQSFLYHEPIGSGPGSSTMKEFIRLGDPKGKARMHHDSSEFMRISSFCTRLLNPTIASSAPWDIKSYLEDELRDFQSS